MISISWARDMSAIRMLLMTMSSTVSPTKASTTTPIVRSIPVMPMSRSMPVWPSLTRSTTAVSPSRNAATASRFTGIHELDRHLRRERVEAQRTT